MAKPLKALLFAFTLLAASCGESAPPPDWTYHGGDFDNARYMPFDQINADNIDELIVAWRWFSIETLVSADHPDLIAGEFKPTPLVVDGMMYVPTSFCQIAALDPGTGELIWSFDPKSYEAGRPMVFGFQHRGLSYWTDGEDARLFLATFDRKLWAVDAKTGQPCAGFGTDGFVELESTLGRKINPRTINHYSPVGICGDTIVVGSSIFDAPTLKEMTPGHIRAYDARTGDMKWIFHTIPQEGEFGVDTWEGDSWKYSGNTNVWAAFASDEELNYIYAAVSTPTNDMYGGHRLGDNLFGESIVCLDAETGERVWHFQAVHHGLWDYDFAAGPNLADVTIDGKQRKILAQVSKQGFTYVLDRITGEPIWPIEERPVPPSTVPGERASPTQPFPTKPMPFDRQGFSEEDIIDFTPELHAEAVAILKKYEWGPMYSPPSEKGTLVLPGPTGGASWQGAAFDPETSLLYVPSRTRLTEFRNFKPDPNRSNFRYVGDWSLDNERFIRDLPLVKPPIARVTAIDLSTGDHVWMTPMGDGPIDHPELKGLDVPPMGAKGSGHGPLVTKSLLFITQGRTMQGTDRDKKPKLMVFDKKTGNLLRRVRLPANPRGNPMTYMHEGRQYIAMTVGGGSVWGTRAIRPAQVIALSLINPPE